MKRLDPEFRAYLEAQIAKGGRAGASAKSELLKYSDDEARDSDGRFASGGGDDAHAALVSTDPLSSEGEERDQERNDELKETYNIKDNGDGTSTAAGIDWAYPNNDADARDNAMDVAAAYGISASNFTPNGPGGGAPTVDFTGPSAGIYSMLDEYDESSTRGGLDDRIGMKPKS